MLLDIYYVWWLGPKIRKCWPAEASSLAFLLAPDGWMARWLNGHIRWLDGRIRQLARDLQKSSSHHSHQSLNLFIYQARESLAWSQQGFWQPSFCKKHDLWSLCFNWGNWVVLLFTAYLEERGSIKKLKRWNMDWSPLFLFSIEAMQRNSTLVLPSNQRFHKLRFLQKLSFQKPCWDQARLYLAW